MGLRDRAEFEASLDWIRDFVTERIEPLMARKIEETLEHTVGNS